MNRTERLVGMVMLLQSQRVTTAAQLASHFEITERTVYRDLAALGEAGVPLVGEAGVGYSLMRGYHLPPVMFSTDEAMALATGGLLAEQMTDTSVRDAMRSALGKVTAVLPTEVQRRVQRLRAGMLVKSRAGGTGPVPLSRVQLAMAEGRAMRLDYRAANQAESTMREAEPLGLVFYLDHWHLIAWCRLRNDVRDFRVDRIFACEVTTEAVSPRRGFDLAAYLRRCFLPEPGRVAVVEFPASVMEYVRRYWGPALQAEESNGDFVRVRLIQSGTDHTYLASWLMSFGSRITVVEPASLRERLVVMARETLAHHMEKNPPE